MMAGLGKSAHPLQPGNQPRLNTVRPIAKRVLHIVVTLVAGLTVASYQFLILDPIGRMDKITLLLTKRGRRPLLELAEKSWKL